jgi:hypothetical protein
MKVFDRAIGFLGRWAWAKTSSEGSSITCSQGQSYRHQQQEPFISGWALLRWMCTAMREAGVIPGILEA